MSLDTQDMATYFSDFATTLTATTWDKKITGIFDRDYVEYGDVSGVMPFAIVQDEDIPSSRASGDLFTINGASYKLIDVEYYEPSLSRLIFANA